MALKLGKRDLRCLGLVLGAFLLLAFQVALGGQAPSGGEAGGFARPHGGLLGVLEIPGRVLGWGGAALCLIGMAYALVTWWAGRRSANALAVLGSLVAAAGIAGLSGVIARTAEAGGGTLGGPLARMLSETLGRFGAVLVTAAITVPGLVLTLAPLILSSGRSAVTAVAAARPGAPAASTKSPYPERRVGPDGIEIPIQFEGHDVGPIRYREPEVSLERVDPALSRSTTAASPQAEKRARLIPGVRYADEAADEARSAGPGGGFRGIHPSDEDDEREPYLPPGVRFVQPAAAPASAPTVDEPVPAPPPTPPPLVLEALAPPAPTAAAPPPPPEPPRPVLSDSPIAEAAPVERVSEEPATFDVPDAGADAEPDADVAARLSSSDSHRKKLAASAMFDAPRPRTERTQPKPQPIKPKPARASSYRDALKGLFTSLPVSELPPSRTSVSEAEAAAAPTPAPEAPGQLTLFEPVGKPVPKAGTAAGTSDSLYVSAVEAALERGSASLVLLKRRLGVGYARAASLMEALVADGVLGEMTASGSRPTLLSHAEWAKRRKDDPRI